MYACFGAQGSPEGERLSALMSEGKIIDQDTVMRLLQRAMRASGGNRFLIDGFPRALDQAESYERLLGDPQMVLFFDAPDDVLRARLMHRGKSSGRVDDNAESIEKRLKTFKDTTMPAVERLKEKVCALLAALSSYSHAFLVCCRGCCASSMHGLRLTRCGKP